MLRKMLDASRVAQIFLSLRPQFVSITFCLKYNSLGIVKSRMETDKIEICAQKKHAFLDLLFLPGLP